MKLTQILTIGVLGLIPSLSLTSCCNNQTQYDTKPYHELTKEEEYRLNMGILEILGKHGVKVGEVGYFERKKDEDGKQNKVKK